MTNIPGNIILYLLNYVNTCNSRISLSFGKMVIAHSLNNGECCNKLDPYLTLASGSLFKLKHLYDGYDVKRKYKAS